MPRYINYAICLIIPSVDQNDYEKCLLQTYFTFMSQGIHGKLMLFCTMFGNGIFSISDIAMPQYQMILGYVYLTSIA